MRARAVALTALAVLVISGFSFGEVRLKSDKPLIELQKTVTESALGGDETMLDIPEADEDDNEADESVTQVSAILRVRVRERIIYVGEFRALSPEAAADMLKKADGEVRLIDDFADYQTYSELRSALEAHNITFIEEEA